MLVIVHLVAERSNKVLKKSIVVLHPDLNNGRVRGNNGTHTKERMNERTKEIDPPIQTAFEFSVVLTKETFLIWPFSTSKWSQVKVNSAEPYFRY